MILQGQQNLEEMIVTILAKRTNSTVKDIHQKVAKESHQYSLPAIYKELGKLEYQGVVVKEQKRYSLRIPWVLDFVSLADRASKEYLESPSMNAIVPKKGERVIRHFTSLLKLNNFWAQVLLILISHSKSKTLFTWMPHSWFHLAYPESEKQYVRSLQLSKTHLYLICGGRGPLDVWAEQFWKAQNITYSFARSPFEDDPSTYWNVVDDYVLRATLDPVITKAIDRLYQTTHSMEQLDLERVFALFQQRVKTTLWIEKNEKKARKIRRTFERFFGIQKER